MTAAPCFFWSQVHERHGLFARRFSAQGMVTGVEPPPVAELTLNGLRFVAGEGVRVSLSLPASVARLDLYDILGRRVAATRLEGLSAGPRDVNLPGTSDLPAGLYFARLVTVGQSLRGRVVVTP